MNEEDIHNIIGLTTFRCPHSQSSRNKRVVQIDRPTDRPTYQSQQGAVNKESDCIDVRPILRFAFFGNLGSR